MTETMAQNDTRIVVIPAKKREETGLTERRLKVAAYCRVSTDQEEQESSYEAQISYYTEKINGSAEWQMAGIFAEIIIPSLIQGIGKIKKCAFAV